MVKNNFFGRQAYLDILEKRIRHLNEGYRQNIAFIGDELVGKTSIIFGFLEKFYDNRTIIIYLEARPEALDSFAKRFITALLYNFLANSGIALKEDLDFLTDRSAKYAPKTTGKIKFIFEELKKKKNNVFTEVLSLCELLNQETGKNCVVILDEFCNLEKIGINNLYREWSKLLISQKNTMYVITSSMKFKARSVLSKSLSLLFGNFEVITVEPFDIKTSDSYIRSRLNEVSLDTGLLNFIVNFTGGYPLYLKVIVDAILEKGQDNLADIIENLVFDTSGILNQRFSNYIKVFLDSAHSQDYISILHLVSSGHNKLKDIAHLMRKTRKELNLRAIHLLELDTITRSGDFLKINDKLFSFWLKFVYQGRPQKALFKAGIENLVKEFIFSAERPVVERMSELLRLFENDTVQIEKKKLKLDHFREIKSLEFSNQRIKEGLLGRGDDSLWLIALKYESLTEEDITEFAKECKRYRHRTQKKIIIAFRDIDANARLRALEEKILTWDINNLNQVLDLFYKPSIIV